MIDDANSSVASTAPADFLPGHVQRERFSPAERVLAIRLAIAGEKDAPNFGRLPLARRAAVFMLAADLCRWLESE